jgi:NAD(P)-dependent dehydrogenase (short-subunit alcohol dehydrogenase family)
MKEEPMETNGINGRLVAVIGGSGGIGLAAARRLASRGARVTIGGRDPQRLEQARASLPATATALEVDATDPQALRRFYAHAGTIDDLVITVTRRGGAGPATALADDDLLGAFDGKTVAHLRALSLALPTLADDGSVTLVTAGSAQSALPGTAGLAAVNGALEAAVAPLARELAPRRVNAVSPGVIETGWWDEIPEDERRATFETFAQRAPVQRNGRPEDVAAAITALIENTFLTGVVLPCDGGLRLT